MQKRVNESGNRVRQISSSNSALTRSLLLLRHVLTGSVRGVVCVRTDRAHLSTFVPMQCASKSTRVSTIVVAIQFKQREVTVLVTLGPVMERFAYAYNKRISYYDTVVEQMQSICMLV